MQRKLFENESCRTLLASLFMFISWNSGFIYLERHLTKSTVKRLDDIVTLTGKFVKWSFRIDFLHRCLQNNRLGEAVKSVRAKMVTRTTAFSFQFHFVKLILYLTWAPPPQIYSQETGWYCHVEMENGRAKCLDRLDPSTPAKQVICSSWDGKWPSKMFG